MSASKCPLLSVKPEEGCETSAANCHLFYSSDAVCVAFNETQVCPLLPLLARSSLQKMARSTFLSPCQPFKNSHLNGAAHEGVIFDLGAHDVEKLLLLFLVVSSVPRSGDVENFRDAAGEVDLAN